MKSLFINIFRPEPRPGETVSSKVAIGRFEVPRHYLWQGRVVPAFWTLGALSSLILNMILIVALILVGKELFAIKELVTDQLIGGLYTNFLLMDRAAIESNIAVDDILAISFDLPVTTNTTVTLTENTRISNAQVSVLSAPTDIILPAGTQLPIALNMVIPVDTSIPVQLNVPVNIQLSQTDLHEPFVGLTGVVLPYYELLAPAPDSWSDLFCRTPLGFFCR
ncbi:MAG: hypothetical protein FVQ83_04055 [Chloroflexi bacterium]|nr:hypothetical protein [Chloroflexota bacterium]